MRLTIPLLLAAATAACSIVTPPPAPPAAAPKAAPAGAPAKAAPPAPARPAQATRAKAARPGPPPKAPEPEAARGLDPDLLYRLMLAEIAGQRGELKVAVDNYVEAARLSRDPRVAERATRIAVYARDDAAALEVARLWAELEPDNVEARQVAAAMLVRRGDVAGALAQLEKVVELRSGERAYQLITSLLSKEKNKDTALAVMEALVARRADDAQALYAYAQLASFMGEQARAAEAVDRALALKPGWTPAVILKSSILARQKDTAGSLALLESALEERPDDTDLRLYYARRLVDERRLREARAQFLRVLESSPDNTDALYAVGLLSVELNDTDTAVRQFERLVKTGRRVAESSFFLGQIEETRKNYDRALMWYRVVRSGQYWLDAQIRTAVVYFRQGDLERARAHLHNIEPNSAGMEVRLRLAESDLLREADRLQEAFDVLTDALGDMPHNKELLYARALVAEKLDRLDVTEADLRAILEREPDNAQALNALGYTLADRSDRLDEALQYIERAYKLRPDDPAIIDSMGWVHYRLGNYEEALKYLTRAFELMNDPEIAAHLGEVLWVTGDRDGAREVWNKAVSKSPDHRALQDVIRRFTE